MVLNWEFFIFCAAILNFSGIRAENRKFTILQPLDHFDASVSGEFNQTYYVMDDFWNKNNGPLIILMGYASPFNTEIFLGGTHFELAKKFNGLLLGIEQRGFGDSLSSEMLKKEFLRFLNLRQILQDDKEVEKKVINDFGIEKNAKKILFGYSFGGFVASFFHLEFPEFSDALFVSSGPILVDYDAYKYLSSIGWRLGDPESGGSPECLDAVQKAFNEFDEKLSNPSKNWAEIADDFKFCEPSCSYANFCLSKFG